MFFSGPPDGERPPRGDNSGRRSSVQKPKKKYNYNGPLRNVEIEPEPSDRIIFSGYDRAFVYPRKKPSIQDVEEYDNRMLRSGFDKAFARPRCQKMMFVIEEYDSPRPLPTDRGGPGVGVGQGGTQNYYSRERRGEQSSRSTYDNGYEERTKGKDKRKGKCLGWII